MLSLPDSFWIIVIAVVLVGYLIMLLLCGLAGKKLKTTFGCLYCGLFLWIALNVHSLNSARTIEYWVAASIIIPLLMFPNREIVSLGKSIQARGFKHESQPSFDRDKVGIGDLNEPKKQ
jgi:hypothetical protein